MNPSGGIPVAEVDGRTIAESNDIIMAIEAAFPDHRPLLPSPEADPERHARVRPLLSLEREVFSAWFRWLTSSANHAASLANMRSLLGRVDAELAVDGAGPFFLGAEPTLVDIFFAPFLERMAASLPYYKGLRVRDADAYPRIAAWFAAMEARPAYRHIQSDYYTHVRDLPPQIGRCVSVPEAAPFADAIDGVDGASWALRGPDAPEPLGRVLQPTDGLGQDASAARREAAERLTANHEAVVRFAARGLGKPGFPPVSAELSDPRATPDEAALPLVDAALRHVVHALLEGTDAAGETLSDGLEPRATTVALGYLRDRISVPRDMSYPAALELRAHLNWMIEHTSRPVA
jgi:glutathione S-transferase